MRNLRRLGFGDILTIAGAIVLGNAASVGLFALLGWSNTPTGADVLSLLSGYLLVVFGLAVIPSVLVLVLTYLSFRLS